MEKMILNNEIIDLNSLSIRELKGILEQLDTEELEIKDEMDHMLEELTQE